MKRICLACGVLFYGDPSQTLCADCASASRSSAVLRERTCRQCGILFTGGPRAWFCPDCRAERRKQANKEHKRRAARNNTRKIGSTDMCVICGKPYLVAGGRQKYCSECAPGAVRAIDRAQSRKWAAENVDYSVQKAARQAATAPTACAVCGKLFVPSSAAVTCSPTCAAVLNKRRHAAWERANREARAEYHKNLANAKISQMTADERREYRDKINARARENYRKRKERTAEQSQAGTRRETNKP